jgi:hypothetical protein
MVSLISAKFSVDHQREVAPTDRPTHPHLSQHFKPPRATKG